MQKLLPVGFYDLLFEEAEKNHDNINKILSGFFAQGYRLIKTPLLEFEENFLREEIPNSFRLTDVISRKSMILRNDITPQISRLLGTRLKEEKLPLKICYSGDVLYAQSEELHADRQQTQVGFEIIGCAKKESDLEVVSLLLSMLIQVNTKDVLIEFSFPGFLEKFLKENQIESSPSLLEAIMKKNLSEIRNLVGDKSNLIEAIALSNEQSFELIDSAKEISEFLSKNFPEVKVRFDLFGDRNASYHHQIYFDVFAQNFSYPIARGGRYKINPVCPIDMRDGDPRKAGRDSCRVAEGQINNLDSVGATIYMNRLRKF
jgi:ATP phosphoribosyltransferase regulatory subunit HisZ